MPHNSDKTFIQFLLTMAFVVMVAIFNWIKRRSQSQEPTDTGSEREAAPPPRPRTRSVPPVMRPAESRPEPRPVNWEEELRRILGGEEPSPPPLPQPAPPPPTPAPARPPLVIPSAAYARPRPPVSVERGLPVELAGLTASAESYQRASQLDVKVADHLREIQQQVSQHRTVLQQRGRSPEVGQALTLLRNPSSLRSAIIASVILGPPKSLEG